MYKSENLQNNFPLSIRLSWYKAKEDSSILSAEFIKSIFFYLPEAFQ